MIKPFTEAQMLDLRENLRYDHDTGNLLWTRDRGCKTRAGMVAGGTKTTGYVAVLLNGKRYMAHRVAWLLAHGSDPVGELDHIDGNKKNNRIDNLRRCTRSQNMSACEYKLGESGVRGLRRRVNRRGWEHWQARITKDRKRYVKKFAIHRRDDAIEWLRGMRDELHGEFACHQ